MQSRLIFLLLTLFILPAQAKKWAYFWGGGGEPVSVGTTIFDSDLKAFVPALLAVGYEVRLSFANGQRESQKLAEKIVGPENYQPFTSEVIKKQLNNLDEEIQNNTIRKGDQILFVISTHGENPDDSLSSSHRIHTNTTSRLEIFDLDRLIKIRDLAEQNGIQFAVMDFSCFSGATLALATAKTCVMASSTAQELSYGNFASELSRTIKPNIDLESAYLIARRQTTDYEAPELSTFANSMTKLRTILNSSASSPVKPAKSSAALIRHENYLLKVHNKIMSDLLPALAQVPDSPEFLVMKSIRETYQNLLTSNKSLRMSFDDLDDAKGSALLRYYYSERILYDHIYKHFYDFKRA